MVLTTLQCPSCTAPIKDVGTCPYCNAEIRREGGAAEAPAASVIEPESVGPNKLEQHWLIAARMLTSNPRGKSEIADAKKRGLNHFCDKNGDLALELGDLFYYALGLDKSETMKLVISGEIHSDEKMLKRIKIAEANHLGKASFRSAELDLEEIAATGRYN